MAQTTNKILFGGRGRGRLVPQEVLDAPLRKPGMLTEKPPVSDKLARLDILFTGPLEDLVVYRVLDVFLFRERCSASEIEKMIEYIFKNIMTDASNADYICKYLYIMFRHEDKGSTLRGLFYKYLEQHYKDSSKIKSEGHIQYRNFITLFAAATHHARNINFAPFDELLDGLLTLSLDLVPSSSDKDIQVFSLCVIRYSQYLRMCKHDGTSVDNLIERENELEDAKKLARQIYLNNDITKQSLAWLCLVVECKDITDDLLEQYSPPIEQSLINLIKDSTLRIRLPKNDFNKYSISDVAAIIDLV